MRFALLAPATLLLAACGSDNAAETLQEDPAQALEEAANQSSPAAAVVLNDAADRLEATGSDNVVAARQALEQAGDVAAATNAQAGPPSGTVQARPNLPGSPNRKNGTQPPDTMISNGQQTGVAGSQNLPQDR